MIPKVKKMFVCFSIEVIPEVQNRLFFSVLKLFLKWSRRVIPSKAVQSTVTNAIFGGRPDVNLARTADGNTLQNLKEKIKNLGKNRSVFFLQIYIYIKKKH